MSQWGMAICTPTHIVLYTLYVCLLSYSGSRQEVQVESGLDEDKALEILSLYVNNKVQRLPEQARSIVRECKGTEIHLHTHTFVIESDTHFTGSMSHILQ